MFPSRIFVLCCLCSRFLLLSSTLPAAACTVAGDAHQTTYSIAGVSGVDIPSCEWSWTHNEVLANHKEENHTVVKNNSISALVTYRCLDNIIYELNCVPQGPRKAVCTTNCTLSALRKSQKDQESSWHLIVAVVVGVVVVVAVAAIILAGLLYYKYKCRISMDLKWIYTLVKPKPDDVEAGSE